MNHYVRLKTADLYRPNARFIPERQRYQALTPFGKLGYSRQSLIDGGGQPIEHPSLLCRRKDRIDGILPSPHEIEALEAAIAFAFLDTNPRCTSSNRQQHVITADNTELFIWPIDVDAGYVTVTTGIMVRTVLSG